MKSNKVFPINFFKSIQITPYLAEFLILSEAIEKYICSQLQLFFLFDEVQLSSSKRASRETRIIDEAARLFSSVGYGKTTVALVANRAGVSPMTIYNNFETKRGLLFAVLETEARDTELLGELLIAKRKPRDTTVINRLVELYIEQPMRFMNKSCWRQALTASLASPGTQYSKEYRSAEKKLQRQVTGLLQCLHDEKVLGRDIDAQSLGELIWNNTNQLSTEFIIDDEIPMPELRRRVTQQTQCIIDLAVAE